MKASDRPKSIRVHLSIRPGTSAYEILANCETAAARRSSAQELMQLAASIFMRGLSTMPPSGRAPAADSLRPADDSAASPMPAYAADTPSSADVIFSLDFSGL